LTRGKTFQSFSW